MKKYKEVLNRAVAPPLREIKSIQTPPFRSFHLDNGIPVYEVNLGTQDVVKIEVQFDAGRFREKKQGVAHISASLRKEGTNSFSSAEIAEQTDFYGGTLQLPSNVDRASTTLFSLHKHLDNLLPLFAEVIFHPVYPQDEIDLSINNRCRGLQVDLTKPEVVAFREMTEALYGNIHPYGYNSVEETYRSISREDLLEHYNRNYTTDNCKIFISGKITDAVRKGINRHLGQISRKGNGKSLEAIITPKEEQQLFFPKEQSLQSAIRIGRRLFHRKHPDFAGFFVLNCIFGGFFGSRLMTNIREDKGFTYNIFSTFDMLAHDGYFYIGTEVAKEVVEPAKREIYHEMDRLIKEPVPGEELQMVQNYLLGNMLTSLDGPFNVIELVKTLVNNNLEEGYVEGIVDTIKTIHPAMLQELAGKYLTRDDMYEIVVG